MNEKFERINEIIIRIILYFINTMHPIFEILIIWEKYIEKKYTQKIKLIIIFSFAI